ncbi:MULTISPECIES: ParB/RepB/Spo0J family partition protein [unclassified Mesorhizobium]|uniref:ParB/RepB/Spo0J family partition protein n=1 Tax=unclassified Mesorhizobium TaxID=325217 RepID=UPI001126D955|nr:MULTISPECIES: ParB/RepB/Spo0J family partition protein [unclassified Mesorhizobium]MBZ9919349.1 ParB/RepB/Spo0J family partition protein [Mesorhizobium sp. BR1-1-7]MBZ9955588.1 ParB/RepB/Spo0J family partition protein [Mesorhizobium sp. BR1-1-15]MBZ9958737.1 ParB/RepB/Spo0J family partition protein [Mesorhizobium sp. BR1-1-14]MBZ9972300.1 ParB/RepB/Spo0J family partition protein [Mesorhizobium sp. BR1-1-12]TPL46039.1 ParB/RepB/Spo0J family partition protein [Mesorhizobium sp. B2-4-4]
MATAAKKITLSSSRDIPFNQLVISQANVRLIKAGVSIEDLAEDIARRTLLQSITVRPVRDADGNETGMFEIPAGGRRYRALELLVKQKRLAKNAPVPCVIREGGLAEEDSLAENIQRAPLHPLDQFRAFLTFREKGMSEEEIAANQFVSASVVKQRLRLASVSPKLLDVYAEDGMTLDQLMAFTVNGDHERQEQVFERLAQSYNKESHTIRRMLTEAAVRVSDKRAQFVGLDAYAEAGGVILRDLFQGDDGGWLQDVNLLERLVADKLRVQSDAISAEGWKWIDVAPDFPYGHTYGLRRLRGEQPALTEQEQVTRDALEAELNGLEEAYRDSDELPEEVDERLGEIETAISAIDERPEIFNPDEIGCAGAFVSIDASGNLKVERGYVRPEDERPVEAGVDDETAADAGAARAERLLNGSTAGPETTIEQDEDNGLKPIPDRLMTELTAHRTLALRHALGEQPDVAFLAALHALTLRAFYRYGSDTCLELDLKIISFGAQTPSLNDSRMADAVDARHQSWVAVLPKEPEDLWEALQTFEIDSRQALFAHCVSLSVNAIYEAYNRRPSALSHADRLAQAVDLDMVAAGWVPTVDTYLGRVTKARILASVREAKGTRAGDRIEHLKKDDMAETAQQLLADTGWLPEPLRTPGRPGVTVAEPSSTAIDGSIEQRVGETAEGGGELAVAEAELQTDNEAAAVDTQAVAAE